MPIAPVLGEFDYTLKGDDTGTVFRLRTLTWMEREEAAGDPNANQLAVIRRALNYGLVGWSNFKREDGSEVMFRREDNGKRLITKETLDQIQPWAIELANAILDRTRFVEEQAKNSP